MPDLLAEALVAARYEQARSVADVLLRRTRLGLLAARRLVEDRDAGAPGRRGDGAGAGLGQAADRARGRRLARDGRGRGTRHGESSRRRPAALALTDGRCPYASAVDARIDARSRSQARARRPAARDGDPQRDARLVLRRRPRTRDLEARVERARELLDAGRRPDRRRRRVGGHESPAGRPRTRRSSAWCRWSSDSSATSAPSCPSTPTSRRSRGRRSRPAP